MRSSDAPARSILLAKTRKGSPSRSRIRIITRVCAWTPSTAETTSTAPSSTASARSTSATKSEWPGVSIRFTFTGPRGEGRVMVAKAARGDAAPPLIESESVVVSPWSTRPRCRVAPVS